MVKPGGDLAMTGAIGDDLIGELFTVVIIEYYAHGKCRFIAEGLWFGEGLS